jgi:hypothetical protein
LEDNNNKIIIDLLKLVKACMRSSEMDLQAFTANGGYILFLLFFLKDFEL